MRGGLEEGAEATTAGAAMAAAVAVVVLMAEVAMMGVAREGGWRMW